jgi:hypothetical protein
MFEMIHQYDFQTFFFVKIFNEIDMYEVTT